MRKKITLYLFSLQIVAERPFNLKAKRAKREAFILTCNNIDPALQTDDERLMLTLGGVVVLPSHLKENEILTHTDQIHTDVAFS